MVDRADEAGALRDVCDHLLDVVARAPAPPRQVRVRAGDTYVEITFDTRADDGERGRPRVDEQASVGVVPAEAAEESRHTVTATMVGVFYHAPGPDKPPFVKPGDVLEAGRQIGVIEAMKLMIPVEADRPGRVLRHLVEDATPVEYGTPLLALETS